MGRLAATIAVYRRLLGARIRSDLQYRLSFALFVVAQLMITAIEFGEILVLFGQIDVLGGFTLWEVAFLYGVTSTSFSLADVFVSQVETVAFHVRTGSFDRFLLRPVGALLQLVTEEFALRRVGKLAQAVTVLAIAATQVDVDWTLGTATLVPIAVVSGSAIFGALWVIGHTAAFWTTETGEVVNSVTYGGQFASQYPLSIYGEWLRRVLLIVPIAFVSYLPVARILGKPDTLGAPEWLQLLSPAVAVASVAAAAGVWRFGVRHYRSTGT